MDKTATPTYKLRDANDPRYPYAIYCANCLEAVTRGGRRLEDGSTEQIKECRECGNDSQFINEWQRQGIIKKQADEGAEVLDTLPPEFLALYTENGLPAAEL